MSTIDHEKRAYDQANEARIAALVDALCARYKELTGHDADDRLSEEIYNAVRFK